MRYSTLPNSNIITSNTTYKKIYNTNMLYEFLQAEKGYIHT